MSQRANYKHANEAQEANNYEEAYTSYGNVIKEDPNYDDAQAKKEALTEKIKASYLTQAEELAKNKDYDGAISKIDAVIAIIGDNTELGKLKAAYNEKKYERDYVDVRNVKFGDSKETVKKYERCEILEEVDTGLICSDTLNGNNFWVFYYFNENDELYMVAYSIDERFTNYDLYISAYDTIVEQLEEKYGKASKVKDQRSSMAKYCTSDGMALQLGYLAKSSVWNLENMTITSGLYCPNDLTFLIAYSSTKIEEAKNKDNL